MTHKDNPSLAASRGAALLGPSLSPLTPCYSATMPGRARVYSAWRFLLLPRVLSRCQESIPKCRKFPPWIPAKLAATALPDRWAAFQSYAYAATFIPAPTTKKEYRKAQAKCLLPPPHCVADEFSQATCPARLTTPRARVELNLSFLVIITEREREFAGIHRSRAYIHPSIRAPTCYYMNIPMSTKGRSKQASKQPAASYRGEAKTPGMRKRERGMTEAARESHSVLAYMMCIRAPPR